MKRKKISRPLERYLLSKAERCFYCGITEGPWEIDHVKPVSGLEGDGNEVENLVVACRECNRKKGTKSANRSGEWVGLPRAQLHKLMSNVLMRRTNDD